MSQGSKVSKCIRHEYSTTLKHGRRKTLVVCTNRSVEIRRNSVAYKVRISINFTSLKMQPLFQYSQRFTIGMVVLTKDIKEDSRICATVSCPVCVEPVAVNNSPKVRPDGDSYITISNYQRHIRRHIEQSKESAAKRKSAAKSTAKSTAGSSGMQPSNTSSNNSGGKSRKRKSRQRLQNEVDVEVTSSDPDDNEYIESEMIHNFESCNSDVNLDLSSEKDEENQRCSPPIQQAQKIRRIDSGKITDPLFLNIIRTKVQ